MGMNGLFKTNYGDTKMEDCGDKTSWKHMLKAVRGKMASGEDEDDFGGGADGVVADAIDGVEEGSPEGMENLEGMADGSATGAEPGMEGMTAEGGEQSPDDAMKIIMEKISASRAEGPKRIGMRMGGGPSEAPDMKRNKGRA